LDIRFVVVVEHLQQPEERGEAHKKQENQEFPALLTEHEIPDFLQNPQIIYAYVLLVESHNRKSIRWFWFLYLAWAWLEAASA
jgi:hypothetical protein